jgi:hypothetical protein
MRDSGRASLSQPRYTAHATDAGGVSDRNPAKSPIRNANNSVICYLTCRETISIIYFVLFNVASGTRSELAIILCVSAFSASLR